MTEQTYGGERRNEVARGLGYAAIGMCIAGPVGAAIGGFIGASQGNREDRIRKHISNLPD
jgi:hypothetical protein